jgi:4-diphosphocytidyl-2-C-methyl-D-erythritol kinase
MKRSAPAKLNRFLAVLGKRADGFHELELVTTVLEGVQDLCDELSLEAASFFSLELSGPSAEGLSIDESNLAVRAWRLLEQASKRSLPAKLHLQKRIPHGAGLGGGSSDAAATLRLGNDYFDLGLGDDALLRLAAQLGSDVPLFLLGGSSLGLGRGERVFPLRAIPLEPLLIVNPGLHVSTPSVYRALSEVGRPFPEPLPSLSETLTPPWRNDLTGAAIWVCPPLAEVREALLATRGEPLLCGSGSSWAARYESDALRDEALLYLQSHHASWQVWTI